MFLSRLACALQTAGDAATEVEDVEEGGSSCQKKRTQRSFIPEPAKAVSSDVLYCWQ
jgi:hypothetical protein